jgi:esterase/lipase superfamily enzyme
VKSVERWYSDRIERWVTVARWGTFGRPVIVFPTAGGDAEEIERFQMIDALGGLLAAGRIKVYSIDSISGRSWLEHDDPRHSMWLQNQFDSMLIGEVVPLIRADCNDADIEIISAGASIGAFWALETITRHPYAFRSAICMSGSYDLTDRLHGHWNDDFYFSSPLDFLPGLEGALLDLLRRRFIVLATGSGRWEKPDESWRVADVLGGKGIPNRVDQWGTEWDHDWPTWRAMLPLYLDDLA